MPTFREEMAGLADELRQELVVDEFTLRLDTVQTLYRTWSGGAPGRGSEVDVATNIVPIPKASRPPGYAGNQGGRYEEGDLILTRVSVLNYSIEDLTGGQRLSHEEFYWLINGEQYRVVREPEEEYIGWRVHLRRVNRKALAGSHATLGI